MRILIFLILISYIGNCQPDTNKAYVLPGRPLTAIRFVDGWYKTYHYDMFNQKTARIPTEIIDSGTYSVGRWTITMKSKISKLPTIKRIKGTDIYANPFDTKSKWRVAARNLYPTMQEHLFEQWKKANMEKFMAERKETVRKMTEVYIKKFCPKYQIIIDSCFCGPGCYYSIINGKNVYWDGEISKLNLLEDINTIVHESTHQYNTPIFKWEEDKITSKLSHRHIYMIEPGMTIIVDVGPNYKTSEFLSVLPKDAPNKISRYKTYVSITSDVSANLSGIYGLLDEFSAYYNGTKAAWDGYMTAKAMGLEKEKVMFKNQSISTYTAWYEFRAFIAWYIIFAKTKYPKIYTDVMNNQKLRTVFREVDIRFKKLIEDMRKETNIGEDEYLVPILVNLEPLLDDFKKDPNEEKQKVDKKNINKKKKK